MKTRAECRRVLRINMRTISQQRVAHGARDRANMPVGTKIFSAGKIYDLQSSNGAVNYVARLTQHFIAQRTCVECESRNCLHTGISCNLKMPMQTARRFSHRDVRRIRIVADPRDVFARGRELFLKGDAVFLFSLLYSNVVHLNAECTQQLKPSHFLEGNMAKKARSKERSEEDCEEDPQGLQEEVTLAFERMPVSLMPARHEGLRRKT